MSDTPLPPPNVLAFPGVDLTRPTGTEAGFSTEEVLEVAKKHEFVITIGIDQGIVSGIGISLPITNGRDVIGYMEEAKIAFLHVLRHGGVKP